MFRVALVLISIFSAFKLNYSAFNYDVGARVIDKVSDFADEIRKASYLPYFLLDRHVLELGPFSPTTHQRVSQIIFFGTNVIYNVSMDGVYIGLETGEFLYYYSSGKVSWLAKPPKLQNPPLVLKYNMNPDGSVGPYLSLIHI